MHGTRDNQTSLYMVPLKPERNENMTEVKIPDRHFAGSLYESKSKADLCTFLHIMLWSPCTYTLISVIKNNFLFTWPGLTKQFVQKFLQKSEATAKEHIRQPYKEKQSTHPKEPNETPSKNPTRTHSVFYKQQIFQGKLTPIKPVNSLSYPAAGSNKSWSPTTTTPTQSIPNP